MGIDLAGRIKKGIHHWQERTKFMLAMKGKFWPPSSSYPASATDHWLTHLSEAAEQSGEILRSMSGPIVSRENYDHPDLHMERHSMPRTHASPIGPTDWNETLDIIVYGSPEQSVEGMKVVCHEMAQTMSDPDGSAMDDVLKDADRLVSCLANKVAKTFDLSLMGASSRSCKYVLNTLMQTFQNKRLAHTVKESTLDSLITELLLWLLDERVPRMDDGSQLLKALNVLMLKILDNAERTSSFVVLINLLRPLDPARWPSPPSNESFAMRNQKFSDLVVKCLIKLTKQMMRTHENCKKVKRETQVFKKTRRNKFRKIKVGRSIKRCAAKRYKKDVESKGKVFKSSTVRPDMTEGQVEHRLKSADSTLVQVKKQLADKSDSLMGMKEDYAASVKEFRAKLIKESSALFLMDNESQAFT
ncbi:hypothetical protein POM88_052644 [Heracleum sosnowskyi]|uniref:Uncharacterized protein n=1 Tax=Heracleum sosnowskyi TaxID=360622 RepID=A0AAD8GQL7_9APIA|nr:hypothetical protein POM88_052644 [Heracleum sosnowskyi]